MSYKASSSLTSKLSKHTFLFGIRLWVLLVALLVFCTLLIVIIIFFCIIYLRRKNSKSFKPHFLLSNNISCGNVHGTSSMHRRLLSRRISEIEINMGKLDYHHHHHQMVSPEQGSGVTADRGSGDGNNVGDLESVARYSPEVLDVWEGTRVGLREIEIVTNGFADENVIGNGDHGVVYRGILLNTTRVAVKRLLSTSRQAEDFIPEVEVISHVRHKNLVKLLGYCMEACYRILVNEHVDNGSLHQWLHDCPERVSPLTWGIRMNIIRGIAKGLAYLHEDIEPKIIHQDLKSRNILLDHQWNPKISDFGIAKLFGPEWNDVTTHSMEVLGYLARDYATKGVLNVRSDVYSFGILVMEIICGRTPVDHNQPQVYLIDWLKSMVANKKIMYVVDPKLPETPSSKELKRIILLALRCVDRDTKHRPTMGEVLHMLEPRDLLLNDEHRIRRDASSHRNSPQEYQTDTKCGEGDFNEQWERNNNLFRKMSPR